MSGIHLIMPMGGLGSRFASEGYQTPKPLIEVDGMPMFKKAISSIDKDLIEKVTIIIRKESQEKFLLKEEILKQIPTAAVVIIEKLTGGATETVLEASDLISEKDHLLIMDCDLWFKSRAYMKEVTRIIEDKSSVDGLLLTFESDSPKYSYAKLDDEGFVSQTAEKKVISRNAIAGAYFFSSSRDFLNAAKNLVQRGLTEENKEYYISPLFNEIIKSGGKVKAVEVEEYYSFGTPEELNGYKARKN